MTKITQVENSKQIIVDIKRKKLDVSNMKALKDDILKVIGEENHHLIINLKEVEFIDSSGLSVLISVFKHLKTLEGSLELSALNEQPIELLEITQLDKIFTITEASN
ncbi:MAG: Unknown protein [uncultured Sulfurovum sp.]|uniref:Anti-sigma factor antagonist n=1 Tax=uncultured Sulfurovum sp. TaxID=269237 RepID=A0A6S6RWA0_9BACT|nr:MAG: Unknown protein [uncultured Sulfurovum sp.]